MTSKLDIKDRHHSVRYSISTEEEINTLKENINKIKNIKYCLIGSVEESEVKGKHVHICISYNNEKNGKAVLKDLGIKDKYHIRPIYRKKYGDHQETIFDNKTSQSFYGYAKKGGILWEIGTACKDKELNNIPDEKNNNNNINKVDIKLRMAEMLKKYDGKLLELSEEEKEERHLLKICETSEKRQYVIARLKTFGAIHHFDEWITKMELDGMKDLDKIRKKHYKCDSSKIKPREGNPYTNWLNLNILGPSGICKSETVRNWCIMNEYSYYEKQVNSEYFDGYTDQEVLIIEEMNRVEFGESGGGDAIKRWCNRLAFSVNKKYEPQTMIRPKYVIFVTNVPIIEVGEEYYDDKGVKNVGTNWTDPMRNRIREVSLEGFCKKFGIKTNITRNKKGEIIHSETIKHEWEEEEHINTKSITEQYAETIDRMSEEIINLKLELNKYTNIQ